MTQRHGSNPPAPGRRPDPPPNPPRHVGVEDNTQMDRIEKKLDALISALAAEGEEEQDASAVSLDGDPIPGDRNQSQSLG